MADFGLVMDYNVTCPDYRFCTVRHRFASPCELWDCNACWWHFKNCTKTEEPATDNCPYVSCQDLPRPSHSHTVTALSVTAVIIFGSLFFFFLRRRLRARAAAAAAADPEADADADRDNEQIPLLDRCRALFWRLPPPLERARDGFRHLIWGQERVNVAPPENLDANLRDGDDGPPVQEDPHRPSAPPAYEEIANAPIIRNPRNSPRPNMSRSLVNQNYGSMDTRRADIIQPRGVVRMEEIPLTHGKTTSPRSPRPSSAGAALVSSAGWPRPSSAGSGPPPLPRARTGSLHSSLRPPASSSRLPIAFPGPTDVATSSAGVANEPLTHSKSLF